MPLTRPDCPTEEALAQFAAGALHGEEADALEAHLDGCRDCSWLVGRLIGDRPQGKESAPGPGIPEVFADRAAHYLLREVVGEGGMGTVYEAEDVRLGRRVALKLLRGDGPQKPGRAERFLREARITAMLEHPNIVPVLEVGELEDGAPYYTQRLVRGRTLAKAIASCTTLAERLRLLPHFRDLCNAIAYAHERGVIHRDLKPSNVLVGAFGETVVVDWGLARTRGGPPDVIAPALEAPVPGLTLDGQAMGTPGYMSPEQAAGRVDEVDERSDVFSLGAVLFEILVGRQPFAGRGDEEILRRVMSSGPQPDAAGPGVPPDLAAVAAKALSQARADRYANAGELEADVAAWSDGRKVAAYRYSTWQLLARTAGRHRATVAGLTVTLLVAIAWLGNVWGRNQELRRQRADDMLARAFNAMSQTQWDRAGIYFAEARIAEDRVEARWGLSLVGPTGMVPIYKLRRHEGHVRAVAFAPDGKLFASGSDDRTLRIFESKTGRELVRLDLSEPPAVVAFTSDGKTVVAAVGTGVVLYEAARGTELARLEAGGTVEAVALSRDGTLLASGAGSELRVWALEGHRAIARLHTEGSIDAVAFLPDGDLVFGGRTIQGVRRWEPREPLKPPTSFGPALVHASQIVTCDSRRLLLRDDQHNASLWAFGADQAEALQVTGGDCRELGVSADCHTLVCLGNVGTLRVWDVDARSPFVSLAGSFRHSLSVAVSADGGQVLVGSSDRTLRLWSMGEARRHAGSRGPATRGADLAWSADGRRLVSADRSGALDLWDPASGKWLDEVQAHVGGALAVASAPKGTLMASAGADGVLLWNDWKVRRGWIVSGPAHSVAFAPGGQEVAAGTDDGSISLVPLSGEKPVVFPAHRGLVLALAYSPSGSRLASAGADGVVQLWDPRTQKLVARLEGHEDEVRTLAFSLDGRRLISGSADRNVRLWDADNGQALGILHTERSGEIDAVAIAPLAAGAAAAGVLLSASSPGTLELWDLPRQRVLATLGIPTFIQIVAIAISPDARRAALLRNDGLLLMQELAGPANVHDPEAERAELMRLYKYAAFEADFIRDEEAMTPPADRR